MPDIPIGQSDIDSLGQKLNTLESTLSHSERALLAGILAIASDAIRRSSGESSASPLVSVANLEAPAAMLGVEGPLPSIRDQFARAFTPGAVGDNEMSAENIVILTIPVRPPPSEV
jgi:hypothetical protein